ncbi:hypothetical protein OIY81_3747 [Cryptosporidium canis]|uniref:Uncharacterized protein n=1 Tax=Cryptosporidium canis TaxID=195482 RepID=A0ABQ8P5L0_9CRYT|nr:hypothetical protein OIY81_3747 [Cryptosporidium canis]KAJ1609128.1 hypothetical protein OJ252_2297 [Cryptosporidium canis]
MLSPGAVSEANWTFCQGGCGVGGSGGILCGAITRSGQLRSGQLAWWGQLSSSPERRSDGRLRPGGHHFASRGASKRGATAGERPACCQPPARLHSGKSQIQAEQEETPASSRPARELGAGGWQQAGPSSLATYMPSLVLVSQKVPLHSPKDKSLS